MMSCEIVAGYAVLVSNAPHAFTHHHPLFHTTGVLAVNSSHRRHTESEAPIRPRK
jgi:hypothetical protein